MTVSTVSHSPSARRTRHSKSCAGAEPAREYLGELQPGPSASSSGWTNSLSKLPDERVG